MKNVVVVAVLLACLQIVAGAEQIVVDGTIPGGNGRLVESEGNRHVVEYEIRDTDGWWFRWCFAVRGAQGRTLSFALRSDKFGACDGAVGDYGPAVSHDGGRTWRYERSTQCDRHGFEYSFGPDDREVRFAQCLQYDPSHWRSFLAAHEKSHDVFREETLALTSRRKRPVPMARLGNLSSPKYRFLFTSRHHANEATATYVVEGIAAQAFAQDALGEWIRKNVQMIVVPFVDFDGVVDGDQGKNRVPRDHNRDYHPSREPIYAEIAAIERIVRDERPDVVMDFHNPAIHSVGRLFQAGQPNTEDADRQRSFARILERHQKGAFSYLASDDVPFGVRWNTAANYKKGQPLRQFAADALRDKGSLVTLWEVPFANAHGGRTLSGDDFRDLGCDILESLSVWLAQTKAKSAQGAGRYKLVREGNSFAAIADGRRFAVLSPADSMDWKLESDVSQNDFIHFHFTPAEGKKGTVNFPEIRLDDEAEGLKAVGSQGLTTLEANSGSAMYLAVAEPRSRRGVVAAWVTSEHGSPFVMSAITNGVAVLRPELQFGMVGAKGCEEFVLGAFEDCRVGLETYGEAVARHYDIKLKPQISGYTTWYDDHYGYSRRCGAGTPASTREFADAVEQLGLCDFGFSFFQIDDFWQDGPNRINGPAKNFARASSVGPYSEGMKPTADYLRAKGILPGLWYMPFSGTWQDKDWWGDKQMLFVKDAKTGRPYDTKWGGTCLDMTNPDAVRYMQTVTSRICHEWGFGYVKYDGMWTGMGCKLVERDSFTPDDYNEQKFADAKETGVGAYRRGVLALREAAGRDTFILACNLKQNIRAMGATYGLVDACRIGGDNGPIDIFPSRYMAGVENGTPRYFLNGRVWYNDPDPVYVRDTVSLDRAHLFATWTSIAGMLFNFSDWLPSLSAERVNVLKRTMAPHGVKTVRPIDFFERTLANAWVLEKGETRVFGLYNWSSNETLSIDYSAEYVGLDPTKTYACFDFWRDEFMPQFKGNLRVEVAPLSCRVISCVPIVDHPVLVSTSRHVSSPAFDVENVMWENCSLRGESKVVAGDRYELRLFVNDGWKMQEWSIDQDWSRQDDLKGNFLRLGFCPGKTCVVRWQIAFSQGVAK